MRVLATLSLRLVASVFKRTGCGEEGELRGLGAHLGSLFLSHGRFSDIYIQDFQHNFGAMGCLRPIHSLFPLLGSALSFVLLLDQKCLVSLLFGPAFDGAGRRKKTKPNG